MGSKNVGRSRWEIGGWAVLGLGVLVLAAGITISIWLVQRTDDTGTATPGGDEATAPGLPAGDSAALGDSVKIEIQRAQGALAVGGTGPEASGLSAADSATLTDSAEVDVQPAQAPSTDSGQAPASTSGGPEQAEPAGGGTVASASVQDSVQFVVRDADGNIAEQGVAE